MSFRVTRLFPGVMLLAILPTTLLRAAEGSAEPPFRFYSTVDGLTQSDVYEINQDGAGYLWFTTARGLNRYDGKEFHQFTIADGLPTNSLTALRIGQDNAVWVGDSRGGVSLIRGTRVVLTIDPPGDDNTPISDIEIFGDRILVVAQGAGLLEVMATESGYRLVSLGPETATAKKVEVYNDDILMVTDKGLFRVTPGPELEIHPLSDSVTQIHADANGVIWTIDRDNRICTVRDRGFKLRAQLPTENELIDITSGSDGTVWVATESQLFSFDGTVSGIVQRADLLREYGEINEVKSLFVDRENTLWLSSDSGLSRFLGDRFRHFRLRTGSDAGNVWSISEDRQGRIWFGTQNKLLIRNPDETLTTLGPQQGLPRGPVRDLVLAGSGEMWAGVRAEGLFRVDTRSLRATLVAGTESLEILDVAEAPDEAIWFSTLASGVFRLDHASGILRKFPAPDETSVYSLDIWRDGSVWYGADDVGLTHLERQSNDQYRQQIYGPELGLQSALFNQLRITDKNDVWVAMDEGGLYRFQSGRFVNHGAHTPLADQTIYIVEALDNGTLLVGGEQGLYQFESGSSRMSHYNHLSGFVGVETNAHATFIDSNNYLWIGTVDGATRMDTSIPAPARFVPTPQIISMETNADHLQITQNAEVDPHQRGMSIEFAAVSLLHPRGIDYSYKMVGMDASWGKPTSTQSVSYSSLPPGSYEFMVRARYPGGDWGGASASRRFTVLPFFWQRSWFLLTAVMAVLLVFRVAMGYRTRHIEMLNENLRAQVTDRTQSIEQARQRLEESNEKLQREIEERHKVDQARVEVETTFRRAFENAPIGMGLLDAKGYLFDANPALKSTFWPESEAPDDIPFSDAIDANDRQHFTLLYQKLTTSEVDILEENFVCVSATGDALQTVVNLSTVRSEHGEFLYAVLQVQDVTESLRLTDKLEYQASYDELTGLFNRRAFETELTTAWERGKSGDVPSYLMFMDLDQFKVVNDTSGHAAGDQLLRRVSEVLLDAVRGDDVVCRLGGDEFGLILWDCPTDVATRIAESIRMNIEKLRFHWDKETYRIGVSIGGLPIDPEAGNISELQQLADAACYAAKEAGRNRVHMVAGDGDSARVHQGQVRWIQRIRDAMDNNRFAIYAQAIKPLDETIDEPERFEILLRLRDPKSRRLIPPGAFLPAAERYGLSVELDEWVVRNLLDALFIHNSFQAEDRSYWINLSGTSVGDRRFASFLVDAIKKSPLPPGTVNFEITETAVVRSVVEAGKLMAELREMGCQFALDDFGSGLSSFGYLKKLPVDYLKIDGMFIRDIMEDETNRIFVKSIIDIAHTLNIKTVAEFVEDADMLEVMRELGTDYVQGFGIGRPFSLAPKFTRPADTTVNPMQIQKYAG